MTIAPSFTTGTFTDVPTARMAELGGLIMAEKRVMPIMPRLDTQNVPPVNSAGASFLSLARLPRSLASELIWKTVFLSVSLITGVIRPSSIATANETWAAL